MRFNWVARKARQPWIELYPKSARDRLLGSFEFSSQAIKWVKGSMKQEHKHEQRH